MNRRGQASMNYQQFSHTHTKNHFNKGLDLKIWTSKQKLFISLHVFIYYFLKELLFTGLN